MSDWREISGDQNLRLSQRMLEQQGEINNLKQQLTEALAEVERLRTQNDQVVHECREWRREAEKLRVELGTAQRERDSLARRCSVRFGEAEQARAEARQACDERDAALAEVKRMQTLVEPLREWRAMWLPDSTPFPQERELIAAVDALDVTTPSQDQDAWLVWSVYRNGWWGPGSRGYFSDLAKAGHYTREQAEQICAYGGSKGWSADGSPSEVMVPVPASVEMLARVREMVDETNKRVLAAIEQFARAAVPAETSVEPCQAEGTGS